MAQRIDMNSCKEVPYCLAGSREQVRNRSKYKASWATKKMSEIRP